MQETYLTFEKTAIVVIDLQKGIASNTRKLEPNSASSVIGNAAKLVRLFRGKNGTTFLVHVMSKDGRDTLKPISDTHPTIQQSLPKDYAEFIEEIKPLEEDIIITKRQWGAFYGTELDLQLRRRGIDTIVLCGISTNIGVETTAREAYQYGYNQIFAVDAMSAASEEEHYASVKFIFPRIGLVRTTDEIIDMLR